MKIIKGCFLGNMTRATRCVLTLPNDSKKASFAVFWSAYPPPATALLPRVEEREGEGDAECWLAMAERAAAARDLRSPCAEDGRAGASVSTLSDSVFGGGSDGDHSRPSSAAVSYHTGRGIGYLVTE